MQMPRTAQLSNVRLLSLAHLEVSVATDARVGRGAPRTMRFFTVVRGHWGAQSDLEVGTAALGDGDTGGENEGKKEW